MIDFGPRQIPRLRSPRNGPKRIPARQDPGSSRRDVVVPLAGGSSPGCFLMALFLFGFALYGHGVYLAELQRLNGWPAALISGASTLSLLLANIFATFTNELVARLGAKRLVLFGMAALAASMVLLAFTTAPWQLYVAFGLMSLGWIGMGTIVSATLVSLWFVRRRGLAISLAFTGASFSGIVVTPSLVVSGRPVWLFGCDADRGRDHGRGSCACRVAWIGPRLWRGPARPARLRS